jgi:hypothetical protein
VRVTDRRFTLRVWRYVRVEEAWRVTLPDLRRGALRHVRDLAALVRRFTQRASWEEASEQCGRVPGTRRREPCDSEPGGMALS